MSIELANVSRHPASTEHENDDDELITVLPPADEGSQAWKYLLGCFIVEAALWAFPVTFGVFQKHYSQLPQFQSSPNIAMIGILPSSLYFLGAPIITPLVNRYQKWQRHMVVIGWAGCVLSLIAASFVNSIGGLIVTQGAGYGISFSLLYLAVLRMLDEWFVRRRGLAYGILSAGGGVSGMGLPFLLEYLLSKHGFRTTLRTVAIAQVVLVAPVLPLLKGRLPTTSQGALRALDLSFFRHPLFYVFAFSNLAQAFGYYIPSLYLPSFASEAGFSGFVGAMLLSLNNLGNIMGWVIFGFLSDRIDVHILVFLLPFASAVSAFVLWGFARSLGLLIAFSLVYGWFAGAFVILWPRFGIMLSDDPQVVYSLMAFGKGIGNLAIGPISGELIRGGVSAGYGLGRYRALIIFLGSSMLGSSLGAMGVYFRSRPRPRFSS